MSGPDTAGMSGPAATAGWPPQPDETHSITLSPHLSGWLSLTMITFEITLRNLKEALKKNWPH